MTAQTALLFDEPPTPFTESTVPFSLSICSLASAYRGGAYCRHWKGHDRNPYRAGTPEHEAWAAGYRDAGEHAR